MFGSFDDWKKYNDYLKAETGKAKKKHWSYAFIYLVLIITFPFFLGASVFCYKVAQSWASLF